MFGSGEAPDLTAPALRDGSGANGSRTDIAWIKIPQCGDLISRLSGAVVSFIGKAVSGRPAPVRAGPFRHEATRSHHVHRRGGGVAGHGGCAEVANSRD